MIETSVARETAPCFGCRGEGCPKCGGTGERPVKKCAACGEPGGSVSAGTGTPLVGRKGEPMYHVGCKPGAGVTAAAAFFGL